MAKDAPQLELEFPSLDFENRRAMYPHECAERISCTPDHIHDLVMEGELGGLDISGKNNLSDRRTLRIPREAWQQFIIARTLSAKKPA